MSLNSEIKSIIQNLTPSTIYLRAVTLNEANVELPRIELVSPVAIHAALPTITSTQTPANVTTATTIQVMFLKKNTSQDDTGEEVDAILEEMEALAHQFYDQLSHSTLLDPTVSIEDYILDAVPSYAFGDEILTGYTLTLDFPGVRRTYYCA